MKKSTLVSKTIIGLAACLLAIAPAKAGLIFHASYDNDPNSPIGSRTGTLQNSAQIIDGLLGGTGAGSSLNGSNEFVIYNGGIPVSGSAERTTSVWVKSSGGSGIALGFGTNNTKGKKWDLGLDANGKIILGAGNGLVAMALDAHVANDGQWHLLTAVLPEPPNNWVAGTELYVDGIHYTDGPIHQITLSGANKAVDTGGTLFHVGAGVNSASGSEFFSGLIDDAAIWNRAFTPTEVKALYGLSATAGLNAEAADAILTAFNANPQPETVEAGGQTWYRHDSGLGGADGEVQGMDESFSVNLGGGAGYVSAGPPVYSTIPGHPDSGVYDLRDFFKDPISQRPEADYIDGRSIQFSWFDLEKEEGGNTVYTFNESDINLNPVKKALDGIAADGRKCIIKITGRPAGLKEKVPYALNDPNDPNSGLKYYMYWHPSYVSHYQALLKAFGDFLDENPNYRNLIALVRLNYNAIDTEWTVIESGYRSAKSTGNGGKWIYPDGMTDAGVPDWTGGVEETYKKNITVFYATYLAPYVPVAARSNLEDTTVDAEIDTSWDEASIDPSKDTLRPYFEDGILGWFHTGASMEENQYFNQEFRYKKYIDFCLPGDTYGFSEQCSYDRYVDKYIEDNRIYFTELQYNYWRLLSELNCGVSYIGVYGEYLRQGTWTPALASSFRFAQKYAGYHADPLNAPGAWVAVRGGGPDQKKPNPVTPEWQEQRDNGYSNFRGDYNLLMSRIPNDGSQAVSAEGPTNQRYSAWARKLDTSDQMRFDINDNFFGGPLNGAYPVTIKVTYLDSGTGSLDVYYDSTTGSKLAGTITKTNPTTPSWETASFTVADGQFNNGLANGTDIDLANGDSSSTVIVHMVEVTRDTQLHEAEGLTSNVNGHTAENINSTLCSNWGYHRTLFTSATANDWVEYTINVAEPGDYDVRVVQVKGPDRGLWQLKIDGTNQGGPVEGYSSAEEVTQHDLGTVTFSAAGTKTFRFQINSKAAASSNYHLGIDSIKLTKK